MTSRLVYSHALTAALAVGLLTVMPAPDAVARVPNRGPVQAKSNFTLVPGRLGEALVGHVPPRSSRRSYVKVTGRPCVYIADYLTGNVYVYDRVSQQQIGELTSPDGYGWGAAASQRSLYLGTFYDTVDEYAPCRGTTPTRTLTGSGYGYPTGIATGGAGTYASEWPTNMVDIWTKRGRHSVAIEANQSATYFLALDKAGDVFATGWDLSGKIGILDRCDSALSHCETVVGNVGFPGGVALDSAQDVFVANQNGSISEYAGCASPSPSCTLISSVDSNFFPTGIALDATDRSLWAAANFPPGDGPCNAYSQYSCGEAIGLLLPLQSARVAGATPLLDNTMPWGIAYWKPSKI
jgi:hypothetical protein